MKTALNRDNLSEDNYKKTLAYAFLLLKSRPRSRFEIVKRLKEKKYPRAHIEKTLEYLEKNDYIHDGKFSRLFISSAKNKNWGKLRIEAKLTELGVKSSDYSRFMPDHTQERNSLREIIGQKIASYKGKKNAYQRLFRFLVSRGFDPEDISEETENLKQDDH